MARRKKLITAEKLMKLGDQQSESEAKVRAGTRQRTKFEAENPERMQSIVDRPFGASGRTGAELGVSHKLAYRLHGIEETTSIHPHGQQELPGMRSVADAREHGVLGTTNNPMHQSRTLPDLAPSPTPWHEMHPRAQARTLQRAAEFGVTPESMGRAFGAQLDQGYLRGQEHGHTPYAAHFYAGDDPTRPSTKEAMQPRDVLLRSAVRNRVDFSTQAVTNGITSPKSKFSMQSRQRGGTIYPNDEAASYAIQQVHAGVPSHQINPAGQGIIALHGNVRRAGRAVEQREAGAHIADLRNPPSKQHPEGSSIFGPKTGPYTNSWLDPHGSSQFFVADVHSGGGGMAPHVSHENPYDRDEEGNIAQTASGRNKKSQGSEREKFLGIPGIHALANHVAQQEMAKRGLQSTSGAQATQWGEEQVGRGSGTASARKQTLVPMDKAYPPHSPEPQVHGQMDIFGGTARTGQAGVHTQPSNVATFHDRRDEVPTGKDRDREEAKAAAIHRNVRKKRGIPTAKDLGNEPYEGWG